jgi:hypothetical protein
MGKIILILLLPLFSFSQKVKLKLNIVEWRFGELGNIIIDDTICKVNAMWVDEKEDYTETMLYTKHQRVMIQKTPTHYYKTVYYKNGKIECVESERIFFLEWVIKLLGF